MGRCAVKFDAQLITLVEVVQVYRAGTDAAASLAGRLRQAMGAFDVARIAALKRGVDAVS